MNIKINKMMKQVQKCRPRWPGCENWPEDRGINRGGAVRLWPTGAKAGRLEIEPEILKEEVEMVQDLILAAVNEI